MRLRRLWIGAVWLLAAVCVWADPPVEPRKDPDGALLPPGALTRLGTLRLRHGAVVTGADFSHDGKILVTSGLDRTVRLWDASNGAERLRVDSPDNAFPYAAILSTDGTRLAVASGIFAKDVTVRIVKATDGREVFKKVFKKGDNFPDHCVAFAPDGKTLIIAVDTVAIYDAATGDLVRQLTKEQSRPRGAFFSPDGKTLITRHDSEQGPSVQAWDPATGKQRWEVRRDRDHGWGFGASLVVAPDSKSFAMGEQDGTISIWDAENGKEIRHFKAHENQVMRLGYSSDGKVLASGGFDSTIGLWNPETGNEQDRFKNSENVSLLALSPDGKTLAVGALFSSGTISLRDASNGKEHLALPGHIRPVQSVVFSADGRTAYTHSGDNVRCAWDSNNGKVKDTLTLSREEKLLAQSADGKTVASWSGKGIVRLMDGTSGRVLHELGGHRDDGVAAAAFSPDGKSLAVADQARDGRPQIIFRFWNVAKGKEDRQITADVGQLRAIAFTPDGKSLISAGESLLRWDIASGNLLWNATDQLHVNKRGEHGVVESIAISPNGSLLAIADGRNGAVSVLETASGSTIAALKTPTPTVKEGQPRRGWFGGGEVTRVAFAPDGRTLAMWCRHADEEEAIIRLWDMSTRTQFAELKTHADVVCCLAISPDGKRLASSTNDTSVLVWDLEKHTLPALPAKKSSAKELDALWNDLAGAEASVAEDALWSLQAQPERALELLQERIRPAEFPTSDRQLVTKLVVALDDDKFEVREKAQQQLEKMGEPIADLLRTASKEAESVEVRERVAEILSKLGPAQRSGERLRSVRSVRLLEQLATPDARRLLSKLSKGAPESQLTGAARSALERLGS